MITFSKAKNESRERDLIRERVVLKVGSKVQYHLSREEGASLLRSLAKSLDVKLGGITAGTDIAFIINPL